MIAGEEKHYRFVEKLALFAAALFFASFSSVADVLEGGYWKGAEDLRDGVKLKALSFDEPRLMKAWMMRIDLRTPGISFVTSERAERWGEPMPDYTNSVMLIRTKRERTVDFLMRKRASGRNVELAVNTSPWRPWCSPWNHKWADPNGWIVSDGEEVSPFKAPSGEEALFVIYKDGRVDITSRVSRENRADVAHVHSGFSIIATNSTVLADNRDRSLHPRTALGLSRDKRFLFFLVVDGRQPAYSLGAGLNDLCDMMFSAGASDIINMDGGGSTTMVVYDHKENLPRMINRHKNGQMRTVAVNLGVVFD